MVDFGLLEVKLILDREMFQVGKKMFEIKGGRGREMFEIKGVRGREMFQIKDIELERFSR